MVQQSLLFVDLNALEISSKLITSKKLTIFTKFHKYRAGWADSNTNKIFTGMTFFRCQDVYENPQYEVFSHFKSHSLRRK